MANSERRIGRQRSEKDAVRYVKDSCSIYLVILRGTSQGEVQRSIGGLVFLEGSIFLTAHSPDSNGEEIYICQWYLL